MLTSVNEENAFPVLVECCVELLGARAVLSALVFQSDCLILRSFLLISISGVFLRSSFLWIFCAWIFLRQCKDIGLWSLPH